MHILVDHPAVLFLLSFATLYLSAHVGARLRQKKQSRMDSEEREDFAVVVGATLTLLGLIIGFSFSMAISRYDQRKNYEEAEANAIGTEWVRCDLLPTEDAAKIRSLLRQYLDQRIAFYRGARGQALQDLNAKTSATQNALWDNVRVPANNERSALTALAVSGMNDVLNSQGYTQASWWNRIPAAAWGLMAIIAIFSNLLVGYYTSHVEQKSLAFLVLPLVLSVSFLLIADIDSPNGGIIRVAPQNLLSLAKSLPPN